VGSSAPHLRLIACLSMCAFGVHQLRHALAFNARIGDALAHQGDAYLAWLSPAIGLIAVTAAAQTVRVIAARWPGRAIGHVGLRRSWLMLAASLMCVFAIQELAEGILASGHPAGLDAVFAQGGWLAVPLAAAFGLLAAAVLREAREAVAHVGLRAARPAPRPVLAATVRAVEPARRRSHTLASKLAGRGPPLTVA
jgi:hypothetical protein